MTIRARGLLRPRTKMSRDAFGATSLASNLHYELVPIKSIEQAIQDLPPQSHISVTCSPTHGLHATKAYTERLVAEGHIVVPHIAARMIETSREVAELAAWAGDLRLEEVFVIAGDAPEPHGPYEGALTAMEAFLAHRPPVSRIGFAGYPDGHPTLPLDLIQEQLHLKQALLMQHGIGGWVSTQMCFDARTIRSWLQAERDRGLQLPVRLGIPGVVDRARLIKLGTRLGVGASLRYLAKNRSSITKLMAPGGYDPTNLVADLAQDAADLGIEALHSFTFNAVAETREWRAALLAP
jgi:methylenetetrahydrofolate reductase (NADH)